MISWKEKKKNLAQAGFRTAKSPVEKLQGTNPDNICNQSRTGRGVQLEISRGLRKKMFGRQPRSDTMKTTEVFNEFVSAVRNAILNSRGLVETEQVQ